MKNVSNSRHLLRAFTLIELLVVIAIIAILAGLLLPVLATVKTKVRIKTTRAEMKNLEAAIKQYESHYGRNPGAATAGGDSTYGWKGTDGTGISTNSDILVTIMDFDAGINKDHKKNPQKHTFFSPAKMVTETNIGGFSTTDFQLRDPWGNPFVISIDLDYDGYTKDALYSRADVSQINTSDPKGHVGLVDVYKTNTFMLKGDVMIWTAGPDKKWDEKGKAKDPEKANKDNILSWQD